MTYDLTNRDTGRTIAADLTREQALVMLRKRKGLSTIMVSAWEPSTVDDCPKCGESLETPELIGQLSADEFVHDPEAIEQL